MFLWNSCKENLIDIELTCPDCLDFRVTDFEPAWSPDGKTIAYLHIDTANGKTGIYLIDPSGNNKRIFYLSADTHNPAWSPDGQWLAFCAKDQIFKMKINGDSLTQLTFEGKHFFPDWSPDNEWISFDSNEESPNNMNFIWKMKADGTNRKQVASDITNGEIRMANWSNSGKMITHIRYLKGVFSSEIFTFDSSAANPNRLTYNNSTDYFPKYSPDGTMIAFTSQPYGGFPQIVVMNSDGTNQKQLTDTQGYYCDWSPDSEWIVYTDSRAVNGHLWIMKRDGTQKQQLTFD